MQTGLDNRPEADGDMREPIDGDDIALEEQVLRAGFPVRVRERTHRGQQLIEYYAR